MTDTSSSSTSSSTSGPASGSSLGANRSGQTPPAPGATVVPPKKKKRRFRNFLLWLLLIAVVGGSIWTWAAVTFGYSSGEKAGFVQDLTKQGWLCKTWEGELAVAPAPGAAPEVFAFTIRNDSVASALQAVLPARVVLSYEHHRGVPSSCFGETANYIVGFRVDQ